MKKGYFRLRELDGELSLVPIEKIEELDSLDRKINEQGKTMEEIEPLYDKWIKIFNKYIINETKLKHYVIAVMDPNDKVL